MIKWIKLYKNTWFGIFILGIVFILIQEIPYFIMPFIKLKSNPLMDMIATHSVLEILEKSLGISTIVSMVFIIDTNQKWFSLSSKKEKTLFFTSIALLFGYYIGWVFYFNGYQSLSLVLTLLVALPPLYYITLGLWRNNYITAILGILFFFAHLANVWTSY